MIEGYHGRINSLWSGLRQTIDASSVDDKRGYSVVLPRASFKSRLYSTCPARGGPLPREHQGDNHHDHHDNHHDCYQSHR